MRELTAYLRKVRRINPDADLKLIEKAYKYAYVAHEGQKRRTGEPYFNHAQRVANYILDLGIPDTASICAALMHDIAEDSDVGLRAIKNEFNDEIEMLVEGLTKIKKRFFDSIKEYELENRRKILLATARDPRVIFIKLCDRLDNLQDLHIFREEKQKRIAQDTLDMYSPIAEKIGATKIRMLLEDQCMKYLHPKEYKFLRTKITNSRKQRDKSVAKICEDIKSLLEKNSVEYESVSGRAKHFYSIYRKMKKKKKSFDQLRDLFGIRILTKDLDDCYQVHEALKKYWPHLEHYFKDYIKDPKANGYQALHANYVLDNRIIEVQIRTPSMDAYAEFGAAIHWKYKGTEKSKKFDQKLNWVREFVKWVTSHHGTSVKELSIDVFKNQIIAITPKGDPHILKEGSTALDFAFAVHSRVGERAQGCVVNGKQVALSHVLKSGDIVSIQTGRSVNVQKPWLRIAKTSEARAKIRKQLGIESEVISPKKAKTKQQAAEDARMLIDLQHIKGLPKLKLSKCCNPKRGDNIVAFYTKDKKFITVHRADCPNQFALDQSRKIEMSWSSEQKKGQKATLLLDPKKSGMISSVMHVLYNKGINIRHVVTKEAKNSTRMVVEFDPISKDEQGVVAQDLLKVDGITDVKVAKK